MPWLINAAQLDKFRKNQKNVVILDATGNADDFLQRHIVGARLLDFDAFKDKASQLPNMLTRDENGISEAVGAYGITNDHKIIFYDNSNLHTSCRALWMFKVFGHNPQQLYILDGGIDAWEKYGGKMETGEARSAAAKNYDVNFEAHYIRTLVQIKTNLHHPSEQKEQIIDVRHPVRYARPIRTPRFTLRPHSRQFFFPLFHDVRIRRPLETHRKNPSPIIRYRRRLKFPHHHHLRLRHHRPHPQFRPRPNGLHPTFRLQRLLVRVGRRIPLLRRRIPNRTPHHN